MTTNKTDFFREPAHFTHVVQGLLPEWRRSGKKVVKIWSAACSTGEEPYTLAMVLNAATFGSGLEFAIAASDIDTEVLGEARRGVYPLERMSDVPPEFRRQGFIQGTGAIARWVKVRPDVKRRVEFHHCNLIEPPYPWQGEFDLIFCRNVMIYFAPDTIRQVVEAMYAAAAPGATLFTGHSESLQNVRTSWQYVRPAIYRKP
jgi:chemotaxis methyl-accepting protein methylase